jgi:hypothetical protein
MGLKKPAKPLSTASADSTAGGVLASLRALARGVGSGLAIARINACWGTHVRGFFALLAAMRASVSDIHRCSGKVRWVVRAS